MFVRLRLALFTLDDCVLLKPNCYSHEFQMTVAKFTKTYLCSMLWLLLLFFLISAPVSRNVNTLFLYIWLCAQNISHCFDNSCSNEQ